MNSANCALTLVDNPVNYKRSVTSQWGEDGIIEEIFRRIGTQNKFCIEFGAWDGKHLSNTWALWHDREWSAVLIEGDEERLTSLENNTRGYERVTVCRKYVSIDGPTSLDNILLALGVPKNPDLLSIDVDGDDYHIFDSLQNFSARVVVVEYNPTVPPEIDLVQAPGEYFGASALALLKLAKSKGYRLVCCTETSCFFVLDSEYEALGIQEPALGDVFPSDNLTYVVTSYDGHAFLTRQPTYGALSHASLSNCLKMHKVRRKSFPKLAGPDQIIPIIMQVPTDSSPGLKREDKEALEKDWVQIKFVANALVNLSRLFTRFGGLFSAAATRFYKSEQQRRVIPWFRDLGDETLRLDYELDDRSVVFDIGGYEGKWASDIFSKYACSVYVFEPVPQFAAKITNRFARNSSVKVFGFGLADKSCDVQIAVDKDASSAFRQTASMEQVRLVRACDFISSNDVSRIDLMKINIEGGEYDLLEHLLDCGLTDRIENIQVQFHDFVPNAEERMNRIQERLRATHSLTYQYPFVWENWRLSP